MNAGTVLEILKEVTHVKYAIKLLTYLTATDNMHKTIYIYRVAQKNSKL